MHRFGLILLVAVISADSARAQSKPPAETRLAVPGQSWVVVRMQGPYDANVALQVVCYFRKTADSDAKMAGAPVELDKHLGGVIASLRSSREFAGEPLETILLDVPQGMIKPGRLLLIGMGDEPTLSLDRMEQVGRIALREAARLGATRVAFAPLIRDQGSTRIETGAVANAVLRGVLLAYDTEKRLQERGFARPYTLDEWVVEAGPTYYDETIVGVKKAITQAKQATEARASATTK